MSSIQGIGPDTILKAIPATPKPMILNSWKDIANYVGRGVRTVQRWESELGMPVRRPRARSRSAVVAMSDEIDRWIRSAPTTDPWQHSKVPPTEAVQKLRQSIQLHNQLRTRCAELQAENRARLIAFRERVLELQKFIGNGFDA